MSAVFGATFLWGVPVLLVAWIGHNSDVDVSAGPVLPFFHLTGYLATIVVLVKRRREE